MNNRHARTKETAFNIQFEKLDNFLADTFYFRDVKAYSNSPSLLLARDSTNNKLQIYVRDRFILHQEYNIKKESGKQFVETIRDENFIHRDCDIISGALTASKIIAPLEILIPDLEISDIHVKFVDFSHYDRKTHNIFFWKSVNPEYIYIEVSTFQVHKTVAKTMIIGRIRDNLSNVVMVKRKDVNLNRLAMVNRYFESLGIESEAYFQKEDYRDYTYPLGFIVSLPSAEIVHKMGGQGGMINVLRMSFVGCKRIPITGKTDIEVRLERPRLRGTFNKIIAKIANGMETYYNGLAIVNPLARLS